MPERGRVNEAVVALLAERLEINASRRAGIRRTRSLGATSAFEANSSASATASMVVCSTSTRSYYAVEGQQCSDGALFMTAADWHIVRSGHPQILGDQRQITGDPFQFVPLFRSHRDAESYCRTSGLWHQGIRPRQNSLAAAYDRSPTAGLSILLRQAIADGVHAIGVFASTRRTGSDSPESFASPTLLPQLI